MSTPGSPRDVTGYFSDLAEGYAAHRPTYPAAAIDAALDGLPAPARALDVGCGTGIAARLLAAAGANVIGLDPNAPMIAEAQKHPDQTSHPVDYRIANAETLPVPDRSADLILCAQSFHWFETEPALREFHRVLAPRGRLALMWNVRDKTKAFARAYEANVRWAQRDAVARGLVLHHERSHMPGPEGLFQNTRALSFENAHPLDWDALLGRARSASYFPRADPLRSRLEAHLERRFREHARAGVVVLDQRTEVTLAEPR